MTNPRVQTTPPADDALTALRGALDARSKADLLTAAHAVLGDIVADYERLSGQQRRAVVEAAAGFLQDLRAAGVLR